MLNQLLKGLEKASDKNKAQILQKFFKTGQGEYGEGDIFLGITVPVQRTIAKKYNLGFADIQKLLNSKIHEHRFSGLLVLINKFSDDKQKVFDFYLRNAKQVNNWDLVDLSCPKIVGEFLLDKPRDVLYKLANSKNLWEKRISIVSTYSFIRKNEFADTLKISELLLNDKHDLIHKAVGWMLREVGKRDKKVLEGFLKKHYKKMPRTMLRYAIEKFPKHERQAFLQGESNQILF